MKWLLPIIVLFLLPVEVVSQAKDPLITESAPRISFEKMNLTKDSSDTLVHISKPKNIKPEIFTSGFIDIINSGQINASARFIRLYIGEQGKFAIPLSIYSGVSANNFQGRQFFSVLPSNDMLITNLINPLGGLVNFSIEGVLFFNKHPAITRSGLLYHTGEKILTGYKIGPVNDPSTGNPINFFNSFVSTGAYFQTGAWERNDAKNAGIFWFATRYLIYYTNPKQLKRVMPIVQSNGIYDGYSLAWGLEIDNIMNLKILFYKYFQKPTVDYSLPIYQFSFNYSIANNQW
ncbi:MAG: hypothetical protein ABI480_00945 [Chitinophagaceae bacterium]